MSDFKPILMDKGSLLSMMHDARLSNSFGARVAGDLTLRSQFPELARLYEEAVAGDEEAKRLLAILRSKI